MDNEFFGSSTGFCRFRVSHRNNYVPVQVVEQNHSLLFDNSTITDALEYFIAAQLERRKLHYIQWKLSHRQASTIANSSKPFVPT